MTKQGRNGFMSLGDAQTRVHAPADAEVIQALAGRNRWLYERATGSSVTSGDAPFASVNPQGTGPGHDHSGPPWGSALMHPLFAWGGLTESTTTSAWTPDRAGTNNWGRTIEAGGSKAQEPIFAVDVWVRPHAQFGDNHAPYSRAYLFATAENEGGAASAISLTAELWSNHDQTRRSWSHSFTNNASGNQTHLDFQGQAYWRLRPGLNRLYVKFSTNNTSYFTYIGGISGNVLAKRTYAELPGLPTVDLNARGLSSGDVTTWTNTGSVSANAVSSGNDPSCSTSGGHNDEPYVTFDNGNSEELELNLGGAQSNGAVFAALVRFNATTAGFVFDGNDATNRNAFYIDGSTQYTLYAGTALAGGTPDATDWHIFTGVFGTSGELWIDGVPTLSGTTNTNVLDYLHIGKAHNGTNYGDFDMTRLIIWDDGLTGVTLEEATRYMAAIYPGLV